MPSSGLPPLPIYANFSQHYLSKEEIELQDGAR